jgi:hypothetical protein
VNATVRARGARSGTPSAGGADVHGRRAAVACFGLLAVGLVLRIMHVAWKFDVDWEPDGFDHVNYARSVFAALPGSLWYGINVWAKPVYTFVVAAYDLVLPSAFPLVPAVQLLNTGFWLASVLVTLALVRERARHWATVVSACGIGSFTYVFFRDSITANTEPMGALFLACALWLWQQRRHTAALFILGLLPLVRLDAALIGVVFWTAAVTDPHRTSRSWLWSTATASVAVVAPVALWDLAGFIYTGSPTFILSHGYSTERGLFGFGAPLHFVIGLLKVDTCLFVFYWAGIVRLALDRGSRDALLAPAAASTVLYFIVISAMWVMGLASAGLLRYFVVVYPAYLLVAGGGLDWLFAVTARTVPRAIPALVVVIVVVTVAQLHWIVSPPQWQYGLMTAVPRNRLRSLKRMLPVREARTVYTDRPEVRYYLHKNFTSPDVEPLERVHDPSATGVFVFIQGWSERWGHVRLEDFQGLEQLARFPGPYGETVYVFRRR